MLKMRLHLIMPKTEPRYRRVRISRFPSIHSLSDSSSSPQIGPWRASSRRLHLGSLAHSTDDPIQRKSILISSLNCWPSSHVSHDLVQSCLGFSYRSHASSSFSTSFVVSSCLRGILKPFLCLLVNCLLSVWKPETLTAKKEKKEGPEILARTTCCRLVCVLLTLVVALATTTTTKTTLGFRLPFSSRQEKKEGGEERKAGTLLTALAPGLLDTKSPCSTASVSFPPKETDDGVVCRLKMSTVEQLSREERRCQGRRWMMRKV